MAWTHYWQRESVLDADAFEKASRDCKVLLAGIDVPLVGFESKGEPVFGGDSIMFNGISGQACEPFVIKLVESPKRPGRPIFSYCKTEKLPYDLCVKSALVILKHYLGDQIRVMSDGTDGDWQDAKQLCLSCLKYGSDFRLDSDD